MRRSRVPDGVRRAGRRLPALVVRRGHGDGVRAGLCRVQKRAQGLTPCAGDDERRLRGAAKAKAVHRSLREDATVQRPVDVRDRVSRVRGSCSRKAGERSEDEDGQAETPAHLRRILGRCTRLGIPRAGEGTRIEADSQSTSHRHLITAR